MKKTIRNTAGTREWAETTLNFINGCSHGCLYCYSCEMATRCGWNNPEDWKNEVVREKALSKTIKKYPDRVMFPSSHDITPHHLDETVLFLRKILEAENEVLIVSKPHYECIKKICDEFSDYKNKILFRFTIGSTSDKTLKFWEPNAPSFKERLKCLKYAFNCGFQTSVSCEPMLDNHIDRVIDKVFPFVTETIWIGKANRLLGVTGKGRLEFNNALTEETKTRAEELNEWQNDKNILGIYQQFKDNSKIRWKESIKYILRRYKLINY